MTSNRLDEWPEDTLANVLFRISVILGLCAFSLGFYMGARHDPTLIPAHAHLNLLGFVALFMTALYYRGAPQVAATRLAKWQAVISVLGAVGMPLGMAAVILGGEGFEPVVIVGTFIAYFGMVLLALVIFKATSHRRV
jgi:drug/metabolite transporter (DMT)-like permease